MSWPSVKLADVCNVIMGQAPEGSSYNEAGEGIPLLAGAGDFGEITPIPKKFTTEASKLSQSGDLILCIRATIGDLNWSDRAYCLGRGVAGLRVIEDKLDASYLWHFICTHKHELASKGTGSTFKQVNRTHIAEWEIPFPPLPEQKRIAAILDKADAIRRKRQQAIQLADDFLRAVFLDMFGELVTSSGYANSQKYKLLELVDYIDYRGKTPEKSESGIPLITAKNVKSGYVDDEPREYIPEENYDAWMTRGFPKRNDVLFTTEAPLGNVALLGEYEKVAIGQRLVALRSKGKVTHEYLQFLLLHPFVQDLIYARSSGSTVKGIRTKELYTIELPVPEMQKQREFSAIYWKSKSLTSNQESAHQLDVLNFGALSQKAFAGQL
ncbi:restriction endonuclease subunit S [Stutzerimonas stutzeri]|uniref:Type I restriction modification DNA specificity domain protein n=1 Tax=Stutzerimonas stutzeri (strain ATCC 17588 / DSM 5190 / CCUG 11256 / JCM 5965 / LMG 11199 / NBRC 14165 / NCIMB 11358 / Stanier 221) TaxID=96563 RepID=F8H488_STUS2|nr:restriction endonuclease subunit S [Stutzerimonas stutzeri]AEJ03416.1 Type I restriction modification DNA specificity domain protein [Stutzerimonas stutzeri]MDI9727871.1 restriction endonuclease subunit S [Stutzerimonas stutzeri]MDI9747533.1 restriction endonuclease subunit S [Stutzerimonas stutzeri]QPT28532.1 restriction endonuclease subunit S [Stutzerimonas stutzeri]